MVLCSCHTKFWLMAGLGEGWECLDIVDAMDVMPGRRHRVSHAMVMVMLVFPA